MSVVERYRLKFQRKNGNNVKGRTAEEVFLYALQFASTTDFCENDQRRLPHFWHLHPNLNWLSKRFLFAFCYINSLLDKEVNEDPTRNEMVARIQRNNGRVRILFLSDPLTLIDLWGQISPGSSRSDVILDATTGKLVHLFPDSTFRIDLTHRYFSVPADPFWDDSFFPHTQWRHSPAFRHFDGAAVGVVCTVVKDNVLLSPSSSSSSLSSDSSPPPSSLSSSSHSSSHSTASTSNDSSLSLGSQYFFGPSNHESKKVYFAVCVTRGGSESALKLLRKRCRSLDLDSPDVRVGFFRIMPADVRFFATLILTRYSVNISPEFY